MSRYYLDQEIITANPQIDPYLCRIMGIYRQYGTSELNDQIFKLFENANPAHIQYIESVKRGLQYSHKYTDISIFDEHAV